MFEQTKALCSTFLEMGIPGFDLMVMQGGKCILRHMGGHSDAERQTPMQGNELYHIYSCSKLITCTAALQLWEKGMFALEDQLSSYMPEFAQMTVRTQDGIRKAEKPILIRQLFEMTAGFSYDVYSPHLRAFREASGKRCPTREYIACLAKEPLLFEPGESWLYSLAHDVLAALVEVLSGQLFEEYVQQHIFRPLGMERSSFLFPKERWDELAAQYIGDEQTGEIRLCGQGNWYRPGSEYASGGAGCVSTVEDYIKFLEGLRTGVLLKPETVELMATDRLNDKQRPAYTRVTTHGYGLGVRTPKTKDSARSEFGWGGAAGAYAAIDMPRELSIYYAQHVLTAPNREQRNLLYDTVMADLGYSLEDGAFVGTDQKLTY